MVSSNPKDSEHFKPVALGPLSDEQAGEMVDAALKPFQDGQVKAILIIEHSPGRQYVGYRNMGPGYGLDVLNSAKAILIDHAKR